MSNCKNCDKPIEVKEGRRPREFCDNNQKCRNEFYRKNKKDKKFVTVPIEQYNTMKTKLSEIDFIDMDRVKEILNKYGDNTMKQAKQKMAEFGSKVQDLNKATGELKPPEQPATNYTVNTKVPKTLEELKGLCPIELKGFDRSEWISKERIKYSI